MTPLQTSSVLTTQDIEDFQAGRHASLYRFMGPHPHTEKGIQGIVFRVWAPNAAEVSLIGNFNGWQAGSHPLTGRWDSSGIWEGFFTNVPVGELYKYHIVSKHEGRILKKGDPFATRWEEPPNTASIVGTLDYHWSDQDWMAKRGARNALDAPMSIYELHIGSWMRVPEENNRYLSYRELAQPLTNYMLKMGFTHVEFLPVMEHPYYGSWGYQITGYFAPSARYGSPQDLMYLVQVLHQHDIGVLLDWVPSHFPRDEHGLAQFDGTHLFEHADPKQGLHPDWDSLIFNYGRNEVRSFLLSNACYWLEMYHIDGLRFDAVASMLYRDYSRKAGEWIPNKFGGRENLEAISLLREINTTLYRRFPDVQSIAEESTAWPQVSRPTYTGGLGFGLKWNMGWMHDILNYLKKESVHRKFHHHELTFSLHYAFSENFVLPLSHDEVVHEKGALFEKMPGNDWERFAGLRLLYGYMYGHPGKKLLFMGAEFAQSREWDHERSLDWHLLQEWGNHGVQQWVTDLNRLYVSEKALHENDFDASGFEWVDCADHNQGVLAFLRIGHNKEAPLLFICHFTPETRHHYHMGVPFGGTWLEILNSDASDYGGSGAGNLGLVEACSEKCHGRPFSISVTLPPLSVIVLKQKPGVLKQKTEGFQQRVEC